MNDSSPRGWTFWRPRVARAVLVGGVLFAVLRFAPATPREHIVEFSAADGSTISALELSVSPENEEIARRVTLHPTPPETRLRHVLDLPNGKYVLEVQATLLGPCPEGSTPRELHAPCERRVELRREVELDDHVTRLSLTP